jgi:hypothetical protein
MTLTEADLYYWKNQNSFTLLEASYLILDEPPPELTLKRPDSLLPFPFPSDGYGIISLCPKAHNIFKHLISLIKKR